MSLPVVRVPEGVDVNGNKIEDFLEEEIEENLAAGNGSYLYCVKVSLILSRSALALYFTNFFMLYLGFCSIAAWTRRALIRDSEIGDFIELISRTLFHL